MQRKYRTRSPRYAMLCLVAVPLFLLLSTVWLTITRKPRHSPAAALDRPPAAASEWPKKPGTGSSGMSEPDPWSPAYLVKSWVAATADEPFPKVLHQSWTSHYIPDHLAKYVASWGRIQPDWAYHFHTDEDNLNLVKTDYPWMEDAFKTMTHIQRADVARLLYMHRWGGVYADLDVEALQPLRPLLRFIRQRTGASAVLGQEPAAHALLLERRPRMACNALLASEAGHPFWLWIVRRIMRMHASEANDDPVDTTGPRMLETALRDWDREIGGGRAKVYVAPADCFFPLWDAGQEQNFREHCTAGVNTVDHFANSTAIVAQYLGAQVVATCKRLASEGFKPTVTSSGVAFAAHHWAHTWLEATADGNSNISDRPGLAHSSRSTSDASEASSVIELDGRTVEALVRLDEDLGRPKDDARRFGDDTDEGEPEGRGTTAKALKRENGQTL